MKKLFYILLMLSLPQIAYNKVNFYKGSLNEVQRTAAIEGKLYFVDFYASYCLPCKLMDQTTFMDEELGSYVSQSYIPLKLNIDAFDAYEIRADYEVEELPTIMIFSSAGILLDTYKGSLTASALKQLLIKHDLPQNKRLVTPPKKEFFADESIESVTIVEENTITKPIVETKVTTNNKTTPNPNLNIPSIEVKTNVNSNPPKPGKPIIPKISTPTTSPTKIIPNQPVINTINAVQPEPKKGNGLYEFTSKKHPSNGFGIQIGLFAEYGNVLTEVEKIQLKFPAKKVLVHITEFNGKVVYRVMVGTFSSYALARNYIPQVKANGFEAFIKDLSTLN